MTTEEARKEFYALMEKLAAYEHAMGILYYDGATTAPKGTTANRAQTMGILSAEIYELSTGTHTVALLEFLDAHIGELEDAKDRRMVRRMMRDIRKMQRIPKDEYVEFERLTTESYDAWQTAKEESDFARMEPYYEKIFEMNRRFAGYCAPEKDPYDYWLNEYEEGLNREICDEFFATLRAHITPLVKKVAARPQPDVSILRGQFTDAQQEALSLRLMETMGLDLAHVGLGTTEHPFTTSLGSHFDERITTHYIPDDFSSSLFSVIHEGGHALYDTGSADELAYTILDGGVSMGIHESQSRFYENLLGRSEAFAEWLFPVLEEYLPGQMQGHTPRELYRALNRAEPSLIRTEADELTYCLHVMVRYELEKRLMAGELKVHDLPDEWNRLYKEYLGVEVPDDRRGVLQDSHWAGGSVGYFPSYALGSAYGAQFLRKMKETVDVDACLRRGAFAPINAWLRERIWQYGGLYEPNVLFERATGEKFDPTVYTSYLEEKFGKLYEL